MFALIDCNSFFASCEKVFRPKLADQPVVVLSNNDGVVVARSSEAKRIGIPMGEPYFKIKHLAERNRVHVFSSNFELYSDMSRRVMQTLTQWTPNIEIYSVDEAFLHVGDFPLDSLEDFGKTVTKTVCRWTGIPVSVGIAPTKTLAKVANETAKAEGIGVCCLLNETERDRVLRRFDIGDVWGVGRRLVGPLRQLGLRTAYDLCQVDPIWMRRRHSILQEQIVRELRGEPCYDLDNEPQPKQSIQVSRSFGETTDRLEDLEEAVATFAARAAEKARQQNSVASAVYVHVNTPWYRKGEAGYYSNGTAISFPVATSATPEILAAARNALHRIFLPDLFYKKAGVVLLQLVDADVSRSQKFLFEKDESRTETQRETERNLMDSVDRINRRLGRGAVFFGSEGVRLGNASAAWKANRNHASPCFSTRFEEFPRTVD